MSLDAHYVIVRRISSNLLDRGVKLSKPVYINKNALHKVTGEMKTRELLLIMLEQIQQRLDEIEEKLDKKPDRNEAKTVTISSGTVHPGHIATVGPHPGLSTSLT